MFCSHLCDRFDPAGYDALLPQLCCKHSHVIPAEDYVEHRLAVNRAIAEVIGEIKGPMLQSLLSSGSVLTLIPLQDVFGWTDRINTPAVVDGVNWTWRLPWPVDTWLDREDTVARADQLKAWTRASGR